MRTVKTKSIPNVPDERLIDSIEQLCANWHNPNGDGIRNGSLYDCRCNGRIIKAIAAELVRRDVPNPNPACQFCQAN